MDAYDEALARKEALSNWLAKTSWSVINEEIENIKTKVGIGA
jgi:dsDNA-binding SOS-regulon protein